MFAIRLRLAAVRAASGATCVCQVARIYILVSCSDAGVSEFRVVEVASNPYINPKSSVQCLSVLRGIVDVCWAHPFLMNVALHPQSP